MPSPTRDPNDDAPEETRRARPQSESTLVVHPVPDPDPARTREDENECGLASVFIGP